MSALIALVAAASTAFTCPSTFSNGPCFTLAKNWTEAQAICEQHGSNLATISNASTNAALGAGGCFSASPFHDWECSWIGYTDLRNEGQFEWASGATSNFTNWGAYEPSTEGENPTQDCTMVCKGGSLAGYSGEFWVDQDCSDEYAFCCDAATFSYNAGTPAAESFLASLEPPPPPPPYVDPNPYADRPLCFSTQLNWQDAQALCTGLGTNLRTISSVEELEKLGNTVHFSRVPASWGIDWRCFWTGLNDKSQEGNYEWASMASTGFVPPFGPFEAGNGDGAADDCIALCQSDCVNASAPDCNDFAGYGYVGNFLMDTTCNDEYAFCCDGKAAAIATTIANTPADTTGAAKDSIIAALGATAMVAGIVAIVAVVVACVAVSKSKMLMATPTVKAMGPGPSAAAQASTSGITMYSPPLQANA